MTKVKSQFTETGRVCVHQVKDCKPEYRLRLPFGRIVQGISWSCKQCGRTGLPVLHSDLESWSRRMERDIRNARENTVDDAS